MVDGARRRYRWPALLPRAQTEVVEAWLAGLGLPPLAAFEASWFYSDSASDIALLQCVTHPVAVRPDPRLRERCRTVGWPVIEAL